MRRMLLSVGVMTVVVGFLPASVGGMTKAELIEKIARKTGMSEADLGVTLLELPVIESDNSRRCVRPHDLTTEAICRRSENGGGAHAKKPKEIVVVGSKVFVVPTGMFDRVD